MRSAGQVHETPAFSHWGGRGNAGVICVRPFRVPKSAQERPDLLHEKREPAHPLAHPPSGETRIASLRQRAVLCYDSPMQDAQNLLRAVSRSFYLSIVWLPQEMRPATAVAYLLARATDTVADATRLPLAHRKETLDRMRKVVMESAEWTPLPGEFCAAADTPAETELLMRFGEALEALEALPPEQAELVRWVLATITEGQLWDLSFFEEHNRVLSDEQTRLYLYRVAGCVGRFWTRLGFLTMREKFAPEGERDLLEEAAVRYGCGLQLVNILRDHVEDKLRGRVYLCSDRDVWMDRAERYLRDGLDYAKRLKSFHVRFASMLPALLGLRTMRALRRAKPGKRVKISRRSVYAAMLRAFISSL